MPAGPTGGARRASLDQAMGDDGDGPYGEPEMVPGAGDDDDYHYYDGDVPDSPPNEQSMVSTAAAEQLQQRTVHGGVISTYHEQSERDAAVHRARVATSVKELKKNVADAEQATDKALRQERTELERLQHLRSVAAAREAELMELRAISETKPNQAEVQAAFGRFHEAQATEEAQSKVADECFEVARRAEDERDALLLALTHQRRKHEALEAEEATAAEVQRLAAPQRAHREARAAGRLVDESMRAEERARHEEEVRMQVADQQLAAARKGHKRAVASLRERVARERAAEGQVDEGRQARLEKRAEAVIALKESTEAAASEMRSSNARRKERLDEVAKQREEEKFAILAKGGNPYQVFRQRDEDARMARERKRVQKELEANMTNLQERIVKDYKLEAKERSAAESHRQAVEEKAKSISSAGKEQANMKYMESVTKAHVTVIDPTSKERYLHPSTHMTVKSRPDWKFGLGMGADPDIIDHMAAKYPDVTSEANAHATVKAAAAAAAAASKSVASKSSLPEPAAASVKIMAHEAAAKDQAVDELLEAENAGLWEEWKSTQESASTDGTSGAGSKAAAEGSNLFGVRTLSVLEKRYLAEAASRQKANQIVKQVVGGKEWVGPPFLCKPAELVFADFDVGSSYELKFTLTNVSYTFNAFRPMDLPVAVRSFFELSHTPPGRMSAGVTAPLRIVFNPKVNEDIESEITFHTSTGPMTVPLKAKTKKCKIAIPSPTLDFGAVVMGEEKTLALTIHNGGALECPLAISVLHETQPEADDDDEAADDGEEAPVFTFSGPSTVAGYSTTTVMMRYAPRRAGDAACLYRVAFGNLSPDEEVTVHGLGVEVPIYLEREVVDLQTCAFDGLYREDIVLHNRSKVSHKVQLRVPRALQGNLEFVPSMGYVQARSSFTVSLKLRASEELLTRCSAHRKDDDVLELPCIVGVPEQVLPVSFVLRAQLTTPKLLLQRPSDPNDPSSDLKSVTSLNFGSCPLNGQKVLQLTLHNSSRLSQKFGFLPLPKGLDVQPGDGLGTILPGESITREVRFSPSAATQFAQTLTCRTSLNQTYLIRCTGQGVMPHVSFSHTKLALPPTAEGDTSEGDVTLTNPTAVPQTFELKAPADSRLKLSPCVGTLAPGQSLRLLVEFTAPVNPDSTYAPYGPYGTIDPEAVEAARLAREAAEAEEAEGEEADGEEGEAAEAEAAEADGGEADGEEGDGEAAEGEAADAEVAGPLLVGAVASGRNEPWMLLAKPTVSCFVRAEGKPFHQEHTLFLSVETPVVAAPLGLGGAPNSGVRQDLGFDSVPVGQMRMMRVTVVSKCDAPLELTADALDPMGPFSLINALPVVPPRGSAEINVRFLPSRQLPARETLTLRAGGCQLKVFLGGWGVSPTLRLDVPDAGAAPAKPPAKGAKDAPAEPAAADDKRVRLGTSSGTGSAQRRASMCHMGDLLVGDESTSKVVIENTSEFALRYHLQTLGMGHSNNGPLPPFDVTPCEAEIEGGKSLELTVTFSPDHASDAFWQLLEVSVPNQEAEPHLLLIRGRCTASAGFLLAPEQQPIDGPALMTSPARDLLGLPAPAASASGLVAGVSCSRQLVLQLVPSGAEGVGTTSLLIGHAAPRTLADIKPAPLEFSFEGLDDEAVRRGFSIDPIKGSLKEGETAVITVSFTLKEEAMAGTELGVIASFGVSQWAEAHVKCLLKGGNPAPLMPETEIQLKGYIAGRNADGGEMAAAPVAEVS